jgi:hypothetical protein
LKPLRRASSIAERSEANEFEDDASTFPSGDLQRHHHWRVSSQ